MFMNNGKYTLTDEFFNRIIDGITLRRITAKTDFYCNAVHRVVKAGEYGGYVESYKNLTQSNTHWLDQGSCVYGDAIVKDNAYVTGCSHIFGNAVVQNDVVIDGCMVSGTSTIMGDIKMVNCVVKDATIKDMNHRILYGAVLFDCNITDSSRVYTTPYISDIASSITFVPDIKDGTIQIMFVDHIRFNDVVKFTNVDDFMGYIKLHYNEATSHIVSELTSGIIRLIKYDNIKKLDEECRSEQQSAFDKFDETLDDMMCLSKEDRQMWVEKLASSIPVGKMGDFIKCYHQFSKQRQLDSDCDIM